MAGPVIQASGKLEFEDACWFNWRLAGSEHDKDVRMDSLVQLNKRDAIFLLRFGDIYDFRSRNEQDIELRDAIPACRPNSFVLFMKYFPIQKR